MTGNRGPFRVNRTSPRCDDSAECHAPHELVRASERQFGPPVFYGDGKSTGVCPGNCGALRQPTIFCNLRVEDRRLHVSGVDQKRRRVGITESIGGAVTTKNRVPNTADHGHRRCSAKNQKTTDRPRPGRDRLRGKGQTGVRDGRDRRFRGRCCGHRKHLGERGTTGSGQPTRSASRKGASFIIPGLRLSTGARYGPLVGRTIRPPRESDTNRLSSVTKLRR